MSNEFFFISCMIGDSATGKSSLMERLVSDIHTEDYKATIGADFRTKEMRVGNDVCLLTIWDTAGQEKYSSLAYQFYRGCHLCIIVYDITDKNSFDRVEFWRERFMEHADLDEEIPMLLLANKCDLVESEWTSRNTELLVFGYCRNEMNHRDNYAPIDLVRLCLRYFGCGYFDGREYARMHNMVYYEVSALTGKNVERAFKSLCVRAISRVYPDRDFGDDADVLSEITSVDLESVQTKATANSGCYC